MVSVKEGTFNRQSNAYEYVVLVTQDVLLSEANFKSFARSMVEQIVRQEAQRFCEEHQEWFRETFNVQTLRISLLEELQRRVAQSIESCLTASVETSTASASALTNPSQASTKAA